MEEGYSRVYAKINLDAIHHNLESMRQKINENTKIMAVIKTDGYGHGAVEIAQEIETYDYLAGFAVATFEEALELRKNGIGKPILILGYTFPEHYKSLIEEEIRPTVFDFKTAKELSECALELGKNAKIHIALDTGMSRIGYQVNEESAEEIAQIDKLLGISIEGVFTHFARADEEDKTFALEQMELFRKMVTTIQDKGVTIPIVHCSNSAGIAEIPDANFDMVRAGITLYGLWPSDEVKRDSIDLKPVMELKSHIVHMKTLEKGRCVSYGGTYQMPRDGVVATIPVGYGDGYPRSLSNKGYVLIHGEKAPILGRVCMDQFMVDVTDIKDVRLYDTVTLFGEDNGAYLSLEEIGDCSGRFNYEFACCIGKRIPRVFFKNGKKIAIKEYL